MTQELYTQLQEYGLSHKKAKIDEGLVGNFILDWQSFNVSHFNEDYLKNCRDEEGYSRFNPGSITPYSEDGTIIVGKVTNVKYLKLYEELVWRPFFLLRKIGFFPLPIEFPLIGIETGTGATLGITPTEVFTIDKSHNFDNILNFAYSQTEGFPPSKLKDIRSLDDKNLISKVNSLLEEDGFPMASFSTE